MVFRSQDLGASCVYYYWGATAPGLLHWIKLDVDVHTNIHMHIYTCICVYIHVYIHNYAYFSVYIN